MTSVRMLFLYSYTKVYKIHKCRISQYPYKFIIIIILYTHNNKQLYKSKGRISPSSIRENLEGPLAFWVGRRK